MADQILAKAGFEKRQEGLASAIGDAKWNAWDCEIQLAVNEYNRHLAGSAGYWSLDWHWIKAMVWVETGAASAAWKTRPMQIGVPGDPGLTSLLSGTEGGDLLVPRYLRGHLTVFTVRTIPAYNIRAGIGYLLMRTAKFEQRTVIDAGKKTYEVQVKAGDSLDKIARIHGSTVDVLNQLNPGSSVLLPGQVLKCHKASVRRVIVGWRHMSAASIALRYNGGGDPNYARKLDYALTILRKERAAPCGR